MNISNLIRNLKNLGIMLFVEDGQLKAHCSNEAITPELLEAIKANKVELISLLSNGGEDLSEIVQSSIALVAKQPGIKKIVKLLDAADKISAISFSAEKKNRCF